MASGERAVLDDKAHCALFSIKYLHKLERSRTKAKLINFFLCGDEVDVRGSGEILRFDNRGNLLTVKVPKC